MGHIEDIERGVEYVLSKYDSDMGCPCNYTPFIYWTGITEQKCAGNMYNQRRRLMVTVDDEKNYG